MEEQGMIERVSDAIARKLQDEGVVGVYEINLDEVAKAAIKAMREPTPEMTAVMANYIGRVDQVSATYLGMIDAALNDQERT